MTGYTVFDTPLGPCGIAWSDRGVVRVQLPEADRATTAERLAHGLSGAAETEPPPEVAAVIDRILTLLAGEHVDFADVPLDLRGVPEFHRRVYQVTLAIPAGETLTYGEVARRVGEPGSARAVGRALGANPVPIIVPCHRVLAADNSMRGFSAPGGVATKRKLLAIEDAAPGGQPALFDI